MDAAIRDAAMAAEPDRYLAATLAPSHARQPLAVLAAFAAELARIPATVSEPMLGSIRLQWWRDAIEQAPAGERTGHPVADALTGVVRAHHLDTGLLLAMIEAREFDLSGALHSDDQGLLAYLEATEAHPFRLSLAATGVDTPAANELATTAGRAYGLARSLTRLPMLWHNGGLPLTAERLRQAGVDTTALVASPPPAALDAALSPIVTDLAAIARTELAKVRAAWPALTPAARAVLLPLAMVEPYFRLLRHQPRLDRMAQVSPLSRTARIGLAYLMRRI